MPDELPVELEDVTKGASSAGHTLMGDNAGQRIAVCSSSSSPRLVMSALALDAGPAGAAGSRRDEESQHAVDPAPIVQTLCVIT